MFKEDMEQNEEHPDAGAAGATVVARTKRQRLADFFGRCGVVPWFTYLFLLYIILQVTVSDMRAVFLSVGTYQLSWIEVLYLLATIVAMAELLKVSKPGINNTNEALFMLAVALVYLVVFVLGTAGINGFGIFNNTEFLMLLIISFTQVVMGFTINGRTLKRAIGYAAE
ncbi:MAG: hypothetical protein ACLFV4_00725 [Candidatus Hydrogenedentota bacterium]